MFNSLQEMPRKLYIDFLIIMDVESQVEAEKNKAPSKPSTPGAPRGGLMYGG